jgi:Uncharacterized conserved protein (DUF2203)
MTIGGDSGSRARPVSVAIAPRVEPPVITLALATSMLPLVSRIVADLTNAWKAWRSAVTRYDTVLAAVDADMNSALARRAQRDVAEHAAQIDALRRELEPLGATCRSPRSGRVEWLTVLDGVSARAVWQPGETAVVRWERTDGLEPEPDDEDEDDPSRP